jgi:hypothetical protein
LYISQLVEQEASSGNAEAVSKRQQVLTGCIFLDTTPEAVELAEKLIEQDAIPRQAAEDALHIAVATVSGMDYLLTWNFKHIANAARRASVELVCRLNNYEPPVICSPVEVSITSSGALAPSRLEKLRVIPAGIVEIQPKLRLIAELPGVLVFGGNILCGIANGAPRFVADLGNLAPCRIGREAGAAQVIAQ